MQESPAALQAPGMTIILADLERLKTTTTKKKKGALPVRLRAVVSWWSWWN
jgi:hypothetical protein